MNLQRTKPYHAVAADQSNNLKWARLQLLRWFRHHARSYPWRQTQNPYRVLIAEMMLQRTRADQVVSTYEDFLRHFPDTPSLARANLRLLKKLLWPLGLHQRAIIFRQMARDVREQFAGHIPDDRLELKQITGIGDYIAGAVLTFAFLKPEWIVDSNVVRVLSRFTGYCSSGEARRSPPLIRLATIYGTSRASRNANLALLDHAALICKVRNPKCGLCPLRERCVTYPLIQSTKIDSR